jgi:NTP pyrophosphatase (non-canonical NTP hydrolase)
MQYTVKTMQTNIKFNFNPYIYTNKKDTMKTKSTITKVALLRNLIREEVRRVISKKNIREAKGDVAFSLGNGYLLVGSSENAQKGKELAKQIKAKMRAAEKDAKRYADSESQWMDDRDEAMWDEEDTAKSMGFAIVDEWNYED